MDFNWSPDEKYLAIVPDSTEIIVINVEDQNTAEIFSVPIPATILYADWSSSNILSVIPQTGEGESSILHFDITSPQNPVLVHTNDNLEDFVTSITWNPTGTRFATVSDEGNIAIWNGTTYEPMETLKDNDNILDYPVHDMLQWTHDGELLLGISRSISQGHKIWQWNFRDKLGPPYSEFFSFPLYFQLSYDDRFFVFGEFSGDVILGDVATKEFLLNVSEFLDNPEIWAAWHPKENILAVNDGQNLYFYEVVETSS